MRGVEARLVEVLREGERVLDHQVRALAELDDKIEQMLRVGIALLAGAAAMAGFIIQRTPAWRWHVLALCGGALWNAWALFHFARGYGVVDREIQAEVGPSTQWLVEQAEAVAGSMRSHLLSALGAVHNSFVANQAMAVFVSDERRLGVRWLLAAVGAYVVAIAGYLLGA